MEGRETECSCDVWSWASWEVTGLNHVAAVEPEGQTKPASGNHTAVVLAWLCCCSPCSSHDCHHPHQVPDPWYSLLLDYGPSQLGAPLRDLLQWRKLTRFQESRSSCGPRDALIRVKNPAEESKVVEKEKPFQIFTGAHLHCGTARRGWHTAVSTRETCSLTLLYLCFLTNTYILHLFSC